MSLLQWPLLFGIYITKNSRPTRWASYSDLSCSPARCMSSCLEPRHRNQCPCCCAACNSMQCLECHLRDIHVTRIRTMIESHWNEKIIERVSISNVSRWHEEHVEEQLHLYIELRRSRDWLCPSCDTDGWHFGRKKNRRYSHTATENYTARLLFSFLTWLRHYPMQINALSV